MPSHSVRIENNRVLLPVFVLDTARAPDDSLPDNEFTALADIGATHSTVSGLLVRELGSATVGTDAFMSANGEPTSTALHSVALAVPVASGPHETLAGFEFQTFSIRDGVVVLKMPQPLAGFDAVIGMDVLMGFRIVIHNGVFTISS